MKKNTAANSIGKNTDSDSFNIIFTCAGKRVELVCAFRDAINKRGFNGQTIGCDLNMAAPAMHHVDIPEIVPRTDSDDYINCLLELAKKYSAKLLVPLTDLDLQTLADNSDKFAQLGCRTLVSSSDTIELCRDKIRFCRFVGESGSAGINTFTLDEFLSDEFYPCFVKPVSGSSAIGAKLINDRSELDAHIVETGTNLMVQQYIPGAEYTIDIFRNTHSEICAVIPRQRLEVRSGEVTKGITACDSQLIDEAVSLIDKMPGLSGVVNLQCRRSPGDKPRFFELNPRFGGGAPLSIAAGVDLPGMVIDETLGQHIVPAIGNFTDRLLMLRYDSAVITQVDKPETLPGFKDPVHR